MIQVLAAGGVNTTVVAAFAVGFVSFISPCVLPLVPGYLSAISGVSFAELQEGEGRSRVIGPALLFCLSFTVMFVALGMTATGIGRPLAEQRQLIRHIPRSTQNTVAKGGVLFAFYSLGLGVPFVLSAVAFSRVTGVFRFFRDHYGAITLVSGVILMAMGVLLFTDELTRLNNQALTWLDDLGLNFFSNI